MENNTHIVYIEKKEWQKKTVSKLYNVHIQMNGSTGERYDN